MRHQATTMTSCHVPSNKKEQYTPAYSVLEDKVNILQTLEHLPLNYFSNKDSKNRHFPCH